MTPTALYRKAGVPKATLSRWRRGLNCPGLVAFDDVVGKVTAVLENAAKEQATRGAA